MKDEDIKKIFTVAWVKERKILVGSVVVVAVLSLFIWIVTLPSAYEQCVEESKATAKLCFDMVDEEADRFGMDKSTYNEETYICSRKHDVRVKACTK